MPADQGISLGGARARAETAQVIDFFQWWMSTLAGMTPSWLRNAFIPPRDWVCVQRAGSSFMVFSADGAPISTLADSAKARARARGGDVLVLLEPHEVFLRQRRLPATSRTNLRNALRLQIPAATPFEMGEVFEDCRILEEDQNTGQVLAEQAIARRDLIREVQAQARECRIDLAGIDVLGEDGLPCGFNLLPEQERTSSDPFLPSLNRGLALAALGLAALVTGLYLLSLERQLSRIDAEAAAIRAQASDVLTMQRTLRERAEAIRVIEAQASNPIRFTALMEQLAETLPGDSWLEGLAYDGKQVSMVGLSRSSDGLVTRFENIPGVVAARIVSSVMRDDRLNADRFRIELILEEPMPIGPAVPAAEFSEESNG